MKTMIGFAVTMAAMLTVLELHAAEDAQPVVCWSFEQFRDQTVADAIGDHAGTVKGALQPVPGVEGRALKFDGGFVSVPSAPTLQFADATFSIAAWVNPYELGRGQQMIVAKNAYSAGKREWGLMLDKDNRLRFYLWRQGWKTIASQSEPRPGHWHHVVVTVEKGHARLYVNGKQEAEGMLGPSAPATDAPLSIGGVQDGERVMQTFTGVLDELSLYRDELTAVAIRELADKQTKPHKIEIVEPVELWSGGVMPKSADIPVLPGVRFSVVKPHQPDKDGGNWLLGTALAWHKGRLYSSFGFNTGDENTASEEARGRISDDAGATWGELFTIDAGEGDLGVSHGVFLSHKGVLWSFNGAFFDAFQRTHTRAYVLDEARGAWQARGVVIGDGFWPMQEPLLMPDGNWIMAGARVSKGYEGMAGNLPAVAISRGEDFTQWELIVLPGDPSVSNTSIWGESTVFVLGRRVTNISRWGSKAMALASTSEDCGRNWTQVRGSNLPMATSKPYAGTLSDGQNYLVCTTTADSGNRRAPLTIALSRPGESTFSRVFVIRHAVFPEGPGPSDPAIDLSYPYAVEHDGHLYVGYAIKRHKTAELAVIPIAVLRMEKGVVNATHD